MRTQVLAQIARAIAVSGVAQPASDLVGVPLPDDELGVFARGTLTLPLDARFAAGQPLLVVAVAPTARTVRALTPVN